MSFRILPCDKAVHGDARKTFSSGSEPLDAYFRVQLSRDLKSRVSVCFVALDAESLVGYYTLSAASVILGALPPRVAAKLPKYPHVPVIRLGRLAVDQKCQGKGFGGVLVADAMARAEVAPIGAFALLVDAKDEHAKNFHLHLGFTPLADAPFQLFHPLGP